MRRDALLFGMLSLSLGSGCFCYYAYPSVSYVPSVSVRAEDAEVHAFRVDIAEDRRGIEFKRPHRYRLSELALVGDDYTLPQAKLSIDHGMYQNWIALTYTRHTDHTVCVRLYRPGYELLEVRSWDVLNRSRDLEWKRAAGPDEHERAADALLGYGHSHWHHPTSSLFSGLLDPGSASAQHRDAMLLAASEYDRIAAEFDNPRRGALDEDLAAAERCRCKADWLRKRATE